MESLSQGVEQLLARAIGPLQFRLLVMPTMVTLLAIRAGLQDARDGQPAFLWGFIARPAERRQRLLEGWTHISRIFLMAIVLDTLYQLMVLQKFSVVQTLIVAITCAIVPYVLFRGPATRLSRGLAGVQDLKTRITPTELTTGDERASETHASAAESPRNQPDSLSPGHRYLHNFLHPPEGR